MLRSAAKILFLSFLLLGGSYAIYRFESQSSKEAKLAEQVRALEEQKQHLKDFVSRLTSERRVAEIVVLDQPGKSDKPGEAEFTTLLFSELARDGVTRLPPRFFTIKGDVVHIDSLVIKFDRGYIEKDDPLRGHSIVLFYRLYGDHQAPADGFPIDDPGHPPAAYGDQSAQSDAAHFEAASKFEAELWRDFWKLADNSAMRADRGVRVAQGESPWRHVYPDGIYTLSLESDGGLNLAPKPIDDLFKQYVRAIQSKAGR